MQYMARRHIMHMLANGRRRGDWSGDIGAHWPSHGHARCEGALTNAPEHDPDLMADMIHTGWGLWRISRDMAGSCARASLTPFMATARVLRPSVSASGRRFAVQRHILSAFARHTGCLGRGTGSPGCPRPTLAVTTCSTNHRGDCEGPQTRVLRTHRGARPREKRHIPPRHQCSLGPPDPWRPLLRLGAAVPRQYRTNRCGCTYGGWSESIPAFEPSWEARPANQASESCFCTCPLHFLPRSMSEHVAWK